MELRLACDPLLRSRMSPLLSFLAPSIPPSWRLTAASRHVRPLMPLLSRRGNSNFHTTARQHADSSSIAADLDSLEDKPRPKPKQLSRSPSSQRRPRDDILENQLESLLDSTFDTANSAKRNPSAPPDESSAAMIEAAFQSSTRTRDPSKYYQDIARKMQFPLQEMTGAGTPKIVSRDAYRTLENTQKTPKRAIRTVRSRPTVGRTIEVIPEKGVDLGRALKNLEVSCAVNRVRQDVMRQRFHERPGMKRKRLKSERWRKLFKESFRATVMRVKEMRRKGW